MKLNISFDRKTGKTNYNYIGLSTGQMLFINHAAYSEIEELKKANELLKELINKHKIRNVNEIYNKYGKETVGEILNIWTKILKHSEELLSELEDLIYNTELNNVTNL